jgi:hypothetical protein
MKKRQLPEKMIKPVFLIILVSLIVFCACGSGGGSGDNGDTTENNVIVPNEEDAKINYLVREDINKVWVTLDDISTFVAIPTGVWKDPSIKEWWVATDKVGQGQICPSGSLNTDDSCKDDVCHIYVFASSDFGPMCCPKSGGDTCSCSGGQAFDDCHFSTTFSANVESWSTWYSLIYLWESQLTIVIAGEGGLQVTPVTEIIFEGEIPPVDQMELEDRGEVYREFRNADRIEGNPARVDVENEGIEQFYYTAPLDMLERINLDQEIIPSMTWHSIENLPLLINQLKPLDYRLETWIQMVWESAAEKGIDLGGSPQIQENYLVLNAIGNIWEQQALQELLLYTIDWEMILMTFFDYSYQVSILSEGDFGNKQIINADARTTGYDSDRARGLLLEAGYENGFDLVLVISSDQEYLIKSADRISQYFREIGIAAEVMVLDSATIYDQIRTMAAAGVPSILYYDN